MLCKLSYDGEDLTADDSLQEQNMSNLRKITRKKKQQFVHFSDNIKCINSCYFCKQFNGQRNAFC